jgi:hypothetical protein
MASGDTRRARLGQRPREGRERWSVAGAFLGTGRGPEQFDGQVPLRLKLEGVMEHGSTGHALNLTDQPLALGFADSRPRLTDEIRATAQNEDGLAGSACRSSAPNSP